MKTKVTLLAVAALGLSACAVPQPTGPSVVALPPNGKNFNQFQREDQACQQAAAASVGYANPQADANQAAIGSAAVGTAVGAAAGALIGAAAGNPGAGAAVGAGAGLITGSAYGAGAAQDAGYGVQARIDTTYAQCMTSYGNTVQPMQAQAPTMPYYAAPYYPGPYYPYPYYYGAPAVRFGYGYGWGYRGWGRRW